MLWVKSVHILFVMAWMAGLFYMPRILVHFVEGEAAGEDTRRLTTMADRLFKFSSLMAVIAVTSGLFLWLHYGFSGGWLHGKLLLVLLLIIYQFQTLRYIQQMKARNLDSTSLFFRVFNEAALLLVVPIIILVVVKPF